MISLSWLLARLYDILMIMDSAYFLSFGTYQFSVLLIMKIGLFADILIDGFNLIRGEDD